MKTTCVRAVALSVALALGAVLLAGCMPEARSPRPAGEVKPESEGPVDAGIYKMTGGRVQVLGQLLRREEEGGFWTIVLARPEESRIGTTVVIANADSVEADLNAMDGSFVSAVGSIREGSVSVRMAGPELEVDTIAVVDPNDVRPAGEPTFEHFD